MLVGAETLIQEKEVALSIAGQQAFGITGLILVTITAAFLTDRLMETVAKKKDLPHLFVKENNANIPYYAIIILAGLAAVLAAIGSLSILIDAASLIFLITFAAVNYIGFQQKMKYKLLSLFGSIACLTVIILSSYNQFQERPIPLIIILIFIFLALIGRLFILRKMNN
jgi:amino acid permease